jgi:SAM-dependent methyltransferase
VAGAGRVLDLGCGDGYLLERLLDRDAGVTAIGLDISDGELALARRRLGDRAGLVRARAQSIPLGDASVDAVVSHLAFTLMPDVEAIAGELARVLAPGGVVAAIVGGGPPAEPEAFAAFLDLLKADDPWFRRAPRLGDARARTREGWEALFGARGFTVTRFDRLAVDLSGTADAVWASLGTMYGVMDLDASARADLRARALAAWAPHTAGDRVACTMVVFLAVAAASARRVTRPV